jgi:hypothetical protein
VKTHAPTTNAGSHVPAPKPTAKPSLPSRGKKGK